MIRILILICLVSIGIGCKSDKTATKATFETTGDEIVDALSAQIEKNPEAANYFQRAEALYEREDYARAIEDLNIAIAKDSLNPDYYHLLADSYLDYFRSRDALETMRKVLEIYPDRVQSLLKLAEMEYILKRYDVSVYNCNLVLKNNPENAEAYFMLGLNFRDIPDVERAINSFQTAVEIDPELIDAWLILGDMHAQKKDKKALEYFNSALLLAPDKPEVKHSKAYFLQNNGDIPGALELYREIIISDPSYGQALLNSGILYLELDSVDRAHEQFDILVGREPTNANAFYYRAQTHYLKGDLPAAKADLQNTLNLNRDDEEVRSMLNAVLKELDAKLEK